MIKRYFLLLVITIISISCVDFPPSYQNITEDKIRLIDFIFEPPEAAPGDSVDLYAIFAGKEVNVDDIKWRFSTKFVITQYGMDTAIEVKPFDGEISQCSFSPKTSCIHLSFKIPEDIIDSSSVNMEALVSFVLEEDRNLGLSKEIITVFKNILYQPELVPIILSDSNYLPFVKYFPHVLNLYNGKIRFFADYNDTRQHTIVSDFIVNYNSRFCGFPELNVRKNTNPSNMLDSIVIYKIKSDNLMPYNFDSYTLQQESESAINLLEQDTAEIIIDRGYGYYIYLYLKNERDSVYSLDFFENEGEVKWIKENYSIRCYFEMEPAEIEGLSVNELINIVDIDSNLFYLYPPLNRKVKNFTLWFKITDGVVSTINRSQGSYVWERQVRFTYTEEYLKQFTK
ncbi:MAG: hypothetical protein N2053_00110 [Chitinispirillaceae bacterium]|nr:hypothetical protein [Chitinispirillaceae bacterium]